MYSYVEQDSTKCSATHHSCLGQNFWCCWSQQPYGKGSEMQCNCALGDSSQSPGSQNFSNPTPLSLPVYSTQSYRNKRQKYILKKIKNKTLLLKSSNHYKVAFCTKLSSAEGLDIKSQREQKVPFNIMYLITFAFYTHFNQ